MVGESDDDDGSTRKSIVKRSKTTAMTASSRLKER